jgi:hypothetical protein
VAGNGDRLLNAFVHCAVTRNDWHVMARVVEALRWLQARHQPLPQAAFDGLVYELKKEVLRVPLLRRRNSVLFEIIFVSMISLCALIVLEVQTAQGSTAGIIHAQEIGLFHANRLCSVDVSCLLQVLVASLLRHDKENLLQDSEELIKVIMCINTDYRDNENDRLLLRVRLS